MVRLKGFTRLTNPDRALSLFLKEAAPKRMASEALPISEVLGRILASDVMAPEDYPPFDRSAVDGYAIRASETFESSVDKAKEFALVDKEPIGWREARQIWTGNPMPKGADAVVMLEYARKGNTKVDVLMAVAPGTNVSIRGEDVRKGDVVLRRGRRLRPEDLGLLAELGFREVEVVSKPRVAILSTGNEIVDVNAKRKAGQIFDANKVLLSNLVRELGGTPVDMGIARDDFDEISRMMRDGLKRADVLITTGGSSVGKFDLSYEVLDGLGKPGVLIHGVSMRPGKVTALALVEGKPSFSLPGNPVASFFGFETFVRPLLLRMLGTRERRATVKARLSRTVPSSLGFRIFLRVKLCGEGERLEAVPLATHGSGMMTTLTDADGYVVIPENRDKLEKGEVVTVHLLGR